VGHRADVAARRRVEGRADLEVDLLGAGRPQPGERLQRTRHCLGGLAGARLQRDDDRIGFGIDCTFGRADCLQRAQARAHEVVGEVGGTGEVVGDAAEKWFRAHDRRGSSMPGNTLITAASSSAPWPALEACMNIWCAVAASGSGNLLARAVSSTRPKSLTKMSTAECGV